MKKIVLVLVAAMVLVFTGCEKKETISMPFDVADVNNIEMYRNAEPYSAEKQVITESEDIADLYSLFSGLEVSDKKTEPVVGETITSFRFNLSDDTSYEIIYCAEAVKSGRLKFPAEKLDYFTSADIGGRWDSYQYEIVPVSESELPGQSENPSDPPLEETHEWDKIPMVMVDGKLYYDTGKESTISGRCGVMDGEITSTVDGSEIPTKDNQSNFGTGFEYQYGADNTIEIFMKEELKIVSTPAVEFPISKEMVARLLAMPRPSLSRELISMEKDGLIRVSGRVIWLRDLKQLSAGEYTII